MTNTTSAQILQITKDWKDEFPSLGVYKPLHLLRRNGPLLSGICLDRTSSGDIYKPIFHYHCLLRSSPALSLSLAVQLKAANGTDASVSFRSHESSFAKSAEKMRALALLPLDGDITLRQFDEACAAWLKQQPTPYWPAIFEDRILLRSWLGQDFEPLLQETESALKTWPAFVINNIGGVSNWIQRVKSAASDHESLDAILDAGIKELKIASLPTSRFLG